MIQKAESVGKRRKARNLKIQEGRQFFAIIHSVVRKAQESVLVRKDRERRRRNPSNVRRVK